MRTVLEAVNSISVELHNFRAEFANFRVEVNERFERLEIEISGRFDDLDKRMEVLAGDILKLRAQDRLRPITSGPTEKGYGSRPYEDVRPKPETSEGDPTDKKNP